MGWLSTGTPNPSPSTAGCQGARCCQSREGSIPWDISVQSPKMQQKKGCSEATTSRRDPTATCFGASLGSRGTNISTALWRSSGPHTLTHTPHMHTHTLIFPLPGTKQRSPHTRSTPSLLLPPKTPQPGRARAHLLSGSPVCLPKVFAAGGTCFDTISSAKEAAHLA